MTNDSPPMWNRKQILKFQGALLGWYSRHRRELPWRSRPEPYRIWVSEIMLQQTQVQTVLPYYERFIERFPSIEALAKSTEEEVLALWAGLGYYSRARNLLRAARKIVEENGGNFPDAFAELLQLPGVGRYTAGAISSIAFNQPYPVVDGNVKRVLSRLHGIRHTVPESLYWKEAQAWVPEGSASNFNQAVMELGALVCTASAPLCLLCPVHSFCEARRLGIQDRIPAPRAARPVESISFVMLALEREGRVLLVRQRGGSLIPGKWALPTREIRNHASPAQAVAELTQSIATLRFPLTEKSIVRHSITHRKIFIHVFYGRIPRAARARAPDSRWVSRPAVDRFLTSSAFKKALHSAFSG
jgi:A/G-specific adenine glycosylase